MSWLYGRPTESTTTYIEKKFAKRPEIAAANLKAFNDRLRVRRDVRGVLGAVRGEGREAAAGHATARSPATPRSRGGCSPRRSSPGSTLFLGAYPITPASSILEELAKHKAFGVRTFQAEDEIAAVGAALGAAFGGSLGVTTSAGPGVVLKSETVGLAITLELPLLDHRRAARRPVDRHADEARAGRPADGAASAATRESPVPVLAAADARATASTRRSRRRASRSPTARRSTCSSDAYLANGAEPWLVPGHRVARADRRRVRGTRTARRSSRTSATRRRSRGRGRSRARRASSIASAGSRRRTSRATSPTTPTTTT